MHLAGFRPLSEVGNKLIGTRFRRVRAGYVEYLALQPSGSAHDYIVSVEGSLIAAPLCPWTRNIAMAWRYEIGPSYCPAGSHGHRKPRFPHGNAVICPDETVMMS